LLAAPREWDVKDYERSQLLARLDREGATVGAEIPERIEVQGEELALHEFVFETQRRETIPPGERERVQEAKKNLRRERLQRRQRLEDDADLSYEAGEALVQSIVGIERALNALESLGPTDLEREMQAKETQETQRWMNFLKQALGKDGGGGGRNRGRSL
jgi:hypothetical protein